MKPNKAILMVAMLVIASSFALADWSATLNTPAASGLVQGTYTLNCSSTTTGGTIVNVTNATFQFYCSDTANSTYYNLTTKTSGANATSLNATWASTLAEDSSKCYFRCILGNQSGSSVYSTASSAVVIDNTVTAVATSLSPSTATSKSDIDFSATVEGANTTSCNLEFDSPAYKTTSLMTNSANTCIYSDLDLPDPGIYHYRIVATDGRNTSTTAWTTLTVTDTSDGGSVLPSLISNAANQVGQNIQQEQKTKSNNFIIVAIIGVLVLGYYLGWFGKKKR
jgi:hypothetical protein